MLKKYLLILDIVVYYAIFIAQYSKKLDSISPLTINPKELFQNNRFPNLKLKTRLIENRLTDLFEIFFKIHFKMSAKYDLDYFPVILIINQRSKMIRM